MISYIQRKCKQQYYIYILNLIKKIITKFCHRHFDLKLIIKVFNRILIYDD